MPAGSRHATLQVYNSVKGKWSCRSFLTCLLAAPLCCNLAGVAKKIFLQVAQVLGTEFFQNPSPAKWQSILPVTCFHSVKKICHSFVHKVRLNNRKHGGCLHQLYEMHQCHHYLAFADVVPKTQNLKQYVGFRKEKHKNCTHASQVAFVSFSGMLAGTKVFCM